MWKAIEMRNWLSRGFIALGLLASAPAWAAQGTGCMPTTGTVSGLTLSQNINAAIAALISSNSGSSAPATDCTAVAIQGQIWLDTTASQKVLKIYDGASWVVMGTVDPTNHLWLDPIAGGSTTLASSGTTDLGSKAEGYISITGTTTITAFGSTAATGTIKSINFAGALTLTYNATSLIIPGAANITTAAGDSAVVVALGSGNWRVLDYVRASGAPIVPELGTATSIASAGTTDLGTVTTHNAIITGTTTITAFGSSANTFQPVYFLKFSGALTLTYNATSLILPGTANITTAANDTAIAEYLGSGNWLVKEYNKAAGSPITSNGVPGANGLVIKNNGGTPNTQIDITADSAALANSSGNVLTTISGYSSACTVNLSTTGDKGIDTGSIASSTVYHLYMTSNGSTFSCLASTSATAPTMPGGYTFKYRVGAMITDGSSVLYRTLQSGRETQYTVTASTNTAAMPTAITGSSGNITTPTWTSASLTGKVPATATAVDVTLWIVPNNINQAAIMAPNNAYGPAASTTNPPFMETPYIGAGGSWGAISGRVILESTNLYYASNTGNSAGISIHGWVDKVNAN